MKIQNLDKTALILFFFAILFQSCNSSPAYVKDSPELIISNIKEQELMKLASDSLVNPYIEPRTLIRGKLNEFYVVRLDFNLVKNSKVNILANMYSSRDKKPTAYLYEEDKFIAYWEAYLNHDTVDDNVIFTKKMNIINATCFPSFTFMQKAGKSIIYLPFIGKNPIPRPTEIFVQVSIEGKEPYTFVDSLE